MSEEKTVIVIGPGTAVLVFVAGILLWHLAAVAMIQVAELTGTPDWAVMAIPFSGLFLAIISGWVFRILAGMSWLKYFAIFAPLGAIYTMIESLNSTFENTGLPLYGGGGVVFTVLLIVGIAGFTIGYYSHEIARNV